MGSKTTGPKMSEEAKALNRIADALILLARATAGEFEQEEVEEPDPNEKPLPPGYRGMR